MVKIWTGKNQMELLKIVIQWICYKICNGEMISGNLIEYICQYFENGILGTSYIRRKGTFIYYGGN